MTRPAGALLLAIGYGAGLATGLAHFPDPWFAVPVLLGLVLLGRGQWWVAAITALAVGLMVAGGMSARRSSWCAARLTPREESYRVRLIEPGEGRGRVTMLTPSCRGAVVAQWPNGTRLPAGREAEVVARWIGRTGALGLPSGWLLIRSVTSTSGHPGIAARWQTRLATGSRALYGVRAPMVDALITGRRGELDPDLRRQFTASGLVHLLAISGFHVSLIAGWLFLALRLCGVTRHQGELIAAVGALGYAAFLGWPAPATRAAMLALLWAVERRRQRHPAPDGALAASALLVWLFDPRAIADVGAWLSIAAITGVTVAVRWSDRALGTGTLVRGLSGSVGALLFTAPITAAVFGSVAPIGVLLNLLAVPLTGLALPAVLASLLLFGLAPSLASALAASGGVLLSGLETVARIGAHSPGAGLAGERGIGVAWPWLLLLIATLWAIRGRATARVVAMRAGWGVTCALWLALLPGRSGPTLRPQRLALLFLDVGQGDAVLLRTPGRRWIVVDAGPTGPAGDAGERVVVPTLRREGAGRIDLMAISHAHRDHVGGATAVLKAFPVTAAIEPGALFADSAYDAWLIALAERGVRWHPAAAGLGWTLDGVSFRVLNPPSADAERRDDLNESSLVLEVRYGDFRALLMGDAGFPAESVLAPAEGPVDLIKVGHHGSAGASGAAFLAAIHPQAGVISVGNNRYGHPSPAAVSRLLAAGVRLWRTDREGAVAVESDGRTFTVRGRRTVERFQSRTSR